MAQLIETRADKNLAVIPAEYPQSPRMQSIGKIFNMMTLMFIGCVIFYDQVLPDGWKQNKVGTCIAVWIGASMVSSMLFNNKAFEIYKGSDLIWSTLENDRLPNMQDLVNGFHRVGVEVMPPQHNMPRHTV